MRIIYRAKDWIVAHWPIDRRDALACGGIGSLIYGVAQVSPPAAWISFGLLMLLIWLSPWLPRKKGS